MKKNLATLALFSAMVSTPALAFEGQCIDHYSKEGSFFSGRTFKSWAEYPGVAPGKAFKAVYQEIVSEGFSINSADKEMGVISAHQNVTGSAKTVPLNVLVRDAGKGSRVEVTFVTEGGLTVGEGGLQKAFCDILGAVGR